MGHQHSTPESSSKRPPPPHHDCGPDRKTILKVSRKSAPKMIRGFEDEHCTYKRMRCPNSPESDLLPPPLNLSVSFAPSSPLSHDESSHFMPNSPFPDSHPLADVSFSPSPPRPTRKLAAAPFKERNRRRTLLPLPATEECVVPTKKKREFNEIFKKETKNVIYDYTPSGTRPGKESSEWKTPVPIATSTPNDWISDPSKMHYTRAPSGPRVTSHILVEKKPDRSIHKAPVLAPSAPTRTGSHPTSSIERGFQSKGLSQPHSHQNPVQMMPAVHFTEQRVHMQMMQQEQRMMHQPPPIPLHKQKPANMAVTDEQPFVARSSASSNTRPLFVPLADPGPLRTPAPKPADSRRPIYPQMGLTPRRVKQRRTMHGLGVTEKMYGSVDVPKRKMPPMPILTHPRDVNGIYTTMAGAMSPMRPNSGLPPMLRTPMYNPPPSGYNFTPTPNPIGGGFSRSGMAFHPQLPSYAQMYPLGGAQEALPSPSHYQNFTRFGQIV